MTDILLVYLQIGVTLLGFATIATVVLNVSSTTSEGLFAIRLLNLIGMSSSVILGAITPLVVVQFTNDQSLTWIISASVALVVVMAPNLAIQAKIVSLQLKDERLQKWRYIPTWTLSVACIFLLVMTFFVSNKSAVYLVALTCGLLNALINSIYVLLSFPIFDTVFGVKEKSDSDQSPAKRT